MGKKPLAASADRISISKTKKKDWRPCSNTKKMNTKSTKEPSQNNPTSRTAVDLFEGELPDVDGLCYLLTRVPGPLKELSVQDVEDVLGRLEEPAIGERQVEIMKASSQQCRQSSPSTSTSASPCRQSSSCPFLPLFYSCHLNSHQPTSINQWTVYCHMLRSYQRQVDELYRDSHFSSFFLNK